MANHFSSSCVRVTAGVCALGMALAIGACAPPPRAVVQPAPAVTLTDANIASIITSVAQAEVDRGRLAVQMTQNTTVRQFAQQMVDDHSRMLQQIQTVTAQRRIAPQPGPTTQQLQTTNTQTLTTLREYQGEDFDRQYIATEIASHQWLLDAIDNSLLPGAQDAELRALLTQQRAMAMEHLRRAQEIQATIGQPQYR
jgi:putative membrane protein